MSSESEIQQRIQIEAAMHGCILMRNNSGALLDKDGRLIRYGLGNVSEKYNEIMKSSDLIGITTLVITPDMLGKKIGVFTAIEAKSGDWKWKNTKREIAQKNFIDWVIASGGFAGFANTLDSFKSVIRK